MLPSFLTIQPSSDPSLYCVIPSDFIPRKSIPKDSASGSVDPGLRDIHSDAEGGWTPREEVGQHFILSRTMAILSSSKLVVDE